jgi:hypothetical protein
MIKVNERVIGIVTKITELALSERRKMKATIRARMRPIQRTSLRLLTESFTKSAWL